MYKSFRVRIVKLRLIEIKIERRSAKLSSVEKKQKKI